VHEYARMETRRVRWHGPRGRRPGGRVAAAARIWLARYVATARNAKGRALAATRVERHLVPLLGRRPLRSLTGDDVRAYRLALEARGLAPQTVVHLLSDLRALLLWAVAERRLARTPFPRRVLPRVPELAPRGFSAAEVAVLVALPEPWGFVLRLLLATGLRWSEACRARVEHVRGEWLEVAHTKSGRLRRVPLPRALLAEVAGRRGRLVPFAAGSPGSFARVVRRRSGITDFHPHRCRHTFAMRWLAAGGSLPVLQELLGHRDLSTTMRYARVSDELVRREAARVAQRLGAGKRQFR
jgi:integrase